MKARDIKHENGKYWVLAQSGVFYVMRVTGVVASISESAYDALDLAVTRCDYLANRDKRKSRLRRWLGP